MSVQLDLVIAGAGIMGLGCALEEARRGKKICILERAQEPASKASWAAAGILVTRDARTFLSPFREFYVRSIHSYPKWLEQVSESGGEEIRILKGGDHLIFNLDEETGRREYESRMSQLHKEHSLRFSESSDLPDFLSPHVGTNDYRVLHFPEESYLNNRDLLRILVQACRKCGVEIRTGREIHGIASSPHRVDLLWGDEEITARHLLISAGAWSNSILELLDIEAPMVPVKGQLMRIPRFHSHAEMVHYRDALYFVPRGPDLVVGATTEAGIWEENFNEQGNEFLTKHIREFLPNINISHLETWTGIRPRTRDRLPLMGFLDSTESISICTGHYKCGISMAPLSIECMSRILNGEKPPLDFSAFAPLRKKGLQKKNS